MYASNSSSLSCLQCLSFSVLHLCGEMPIKLSSISFHYSILLLINLNLVVTNLSTISASTMWFHQAAWVINFHVQCVLRKFSSEFNVFADYWEARLCVCPLRSSQVAHAPVPRAPGNHMFAGIFLFLCKCIILWSYLCRTEGYVKLQLRLCLISKWSYANKISPDTFISSNFIFGI